MHFVGDPATPRAAIVEALGAICEHAAGRGLRILLKFLPDTGVGDIETALAVVAETGASNLEVMLDTGHLTNSGGGLEDVARHAAAMGGVQINDLRQGSKDRSRIWPGEGDLPLREMLGHIRRARPAMPIGVEVINRALFSLPAADVAQRAAESLRWALEGADA
jgi:sugar phosphate isomerase/epimerase